MPKPLLRDDISSKLAINQEDRCDCLPPMVLLVEHLNVVLHKIFGMEATWEKENNDHSYRSLVISLAIYTLSL